MLPDGSADVDPSPVGMFVLPANRQQHPEAFMLQDLRHGIRLLLQNKGWTLVVVLSVALGIGANTALFSSMNGLWFKTIGVDRPDTLVRLKWVGKNDMGNEYSDYGLSGKVYVGRYIASSS